MLGSLPLVFIQHHPQAPLEMICDACNFQTFNQKLWNKHIQIHDEGGEKTEGLTCQFCYFVTSDSESIERHIATTHPRTPNTKSDTKSLEKTESDIVKSADTNENTSESHSKPKRGRQAKKKIVKMISCPDCLFEADEPEKITDHQNKFHA